MTIDYAQEDDVKSKPLVAVQHRPVFANALSASNTSSTQAILDCGFYPEEMESAYLRATEAAARRARREPPRVYSGAEILAYEQSRQ